MQRVEKQSYNFFLALEGVDMCLYNIEEYKTRMKIGYKVLDKVEGGFSTPFACTKLRKNIKHNTNKHKINYNNLAWSEEHEGFFTFFREKEYAERYKEQVGKGRLDRHNSNLIIAKINVFGKIKKGTQDICLLQN